MRGLAAAVVFILLATVSVDRERAPRVAARVAALRPTVVEPLPPPLQVRVEPHPGRASRGEARRSRLSVGQRLDVTEYCWTGNRTASGLWPELGMAAGNRWPLGARLHLDGYGDVTVQDRIGWGSDVDIYAGQGPACERRASAWGRRHLLVEASR